MAIRCFRDQQQGGGMGGHERGVEANDHHAEESRRTAHQEPDETEPEERHGPGDRGWIPDLAGTPARQAQLEQPTAASRRSA